MLHTMRTFWGIGTRTFVLLLVLSVSAGAAHAQQWADKMFSEKNHNFGVVARGAKAEHRFTFRNIYVEDIHIAGVRSSCGCTSVWIENPLVKTHEEGAIVAHLNSDRFLGQKGATITVTIDRPFPAEVRLQVSSYIRSDVVFSPGSVQLGTVPAGNEVERTVELRYHGGTAWRVVDVQSSNPHIECEVAPIRGPQGQTVYQLNVRVDGQLPPGYVHEQLIVHTNDRQRTQIPLLVEGVIQAPVVISPSPLRLGVVQAGETVRKTIVIRGAQPFRITSISSDDQRFHFAEVDPAPKTLHMVAVTFSADDAAGKVDDRIRIETDLMNTEELAATVTVSPDRG